MKLLVADDDLEISRALKTVLERSKYTVDTVFNGDDALDYLQSGSYDGVILDIIMPGKDGLAVLREMRERGDATPVLLLSPRGELPDRAAGLDIRADDCLPKPFAVTELLSRVRALLRRTTENTRLICVGDIRLDQERHTVHAGETQVDLTFKEFELLRFPMINSKVVLSRETIMQAVWESTYSGETRTVDMHIKSLRRKLGACGNQIGTVRNVGYVIS